MATLRLAAAEIARWSLTKRLARLFGRPSRSIAHRGRRRLSTPRGFEPKPGTTPESLLERLLQLERALAGSAPVWLTSLGKSTWI